MNQNYPLSARIFIGLFFVFSNLTSHSFAYSNTILSKELNAKLKVLGKCQTFALFSLGLSEDELNTLSKIKIAKTNEYNNFGDFNKLNEEVTSYLTSQGNNQALARDVSKIIERIIDETLAVFKVDSAWIALRSFDKNDFFDQPRWHTDGHYFHPYNGKQYKVAITLKGPQTLFKEISPKVRAKFNELQNNQTEKMENRAKINQLLGGSEEEENLKPQGVIFVVGGKENGAIHSEPPIHTQRLFLSILPGTKAQIDELYQNWHPYEKRKG